MSKLGGDCAYYVSPLLLRFPSINTPLSIFPGKIQTGTEFLRALPSSSQEANRLVPCSKF
jgi:hypothetical protein